MSSSDDEQTEALSLRKIMESKWAIWGIVFIAVLLLCVTATVTFALRNRASAKPTMYSPMSEVESKYDMANMQVTSSNGLGVDAGSTPVVTPGTSGGAPVGPAPTTTTANGQAAALKIGPAPSADETAPLQPVTSALTTNPVSLQAGVDAQNGTSVNAGAAGINTGVNLNW